MRRLAPWRRQRGRYRSPARYGFINACGACAHRAITTSATMAIAYGSMRQHEADLIRQLQPTTPGTGLLQAQLRRSRRRGATAPRAW